MFRNLFLLLILVCSAPAMGQERHIKDLEQHIYRLNNEFKYDQSITEIRNFLNTSKSNDDRYYGFLSSPILTGGSLMILLPYDISTRRWLMD
jgi:hypothetical protein